MNKKLKGSLIIFGSVALWMVVATVLPNYYSLRSPNENSFEFINIATWITIFSFLGICFGLIQFLNNLLLKKVIIGIAILISLVPAISSLKLFFNIDSCLDSGGRWDYLNGKCETKRNQQ